MFLFFINHFAGSNNNVDKNHKNGNIRNVLKLTMIPPKPMMSSMTLSPMTYLTSVDALM
jgi:hypothetical protein